MKALIFSLCLVMTVMISGAQSINFFTTNYVSLTVPQRYSGDITYCDGAKMLFTKNLMTVVHDKTLLNSFTNIVSSVSVFEEVAGGTLKYIGNSITAKNTTYVVTYDFSQTQTIQIPNNGKTISVLIGVGVKMVARVTTKERGVDISTPISLGFAVMKKKVVGSLDVRATGIGSKTINSLMYVTSDLSPASIETALQSVASIKSHIYDEDVVVDPEFLAFNSTGATTGTYNDILNSIESDRNFNSQNQQQQQQQRQQPQQQQQIQQRQ